ncbi:MAG: hypothetical protein ABWZ77_04790 [Naasia sp.]
MTLSQEQQPQERRGTGVAAAGQPRSRREARDLERRAQAESSPVDLPEGHPSGVVDLEGSGTIWDNISRRAASQLSDAASEAERRTGRRVADRDEAPAPEPLTYATQARPNIPTYDGPSFRSRPTPPAPAQAPTAAETTGDVAAFRERSFAPARAQGAPRFTQTTVAGLDYHTQTRTPPLRAASPAPVPDAADLDHTLTRRELRVMRETGALPPFSPADLAPVAPAAKVEAPEAPSVSPPVGHREPAPLTPVAGIPLGSAFSSFEDTATAPMSAVERAEIDAEKPVVAAPIEFDDEAEQLAEPLPASPEAVSLFGREPAPITGLQGFEALIAQASAGLDAPSVPATGPTPVMAPQPMRKPAEPRPFAELPEAEKTFTPPRGHWSIQAAEEEEATPLPFDGLLSRNVGSSTGSTNALIMPNDPQPDMMQALNSTGEILITGSLDLPRSLSSTGATSDHFDSSEIDRLFEASQDEHHADVAPVRAARAVSTHTSTRSVVTPHKGRGLSLPVMLAVTAGGLAVLVAGLFVGGLAFGWF